MKRLLFVLGLLWAGIAQAQQAPIVLTEGNRPSYCAAVGAAGLTPSVGVGEILSISGSATKTIRVVSTEVSGVATAATYDNLLWLKRSTAYSGGTAVASTGVPMDSVADPAATATVQRWTANPTAGTLVGVIRSFRMQWGTTASGPVPVAHVYGRDNNRAVVLRGATESFALNGNVPTGGVVQFSVCWVEE